jgi:hypothetical protein
MNLRHSITAASLLACPPALAQNEPEAEVQSPCIESCVSTQQLCRTGCVPCSPDGEPDLSDPEVIDACLDV